MGAITLANIEKSFGATDVLKDVSLDIKNGEFLTLVGPSGCGKSTLLRILAGLEAPDGGTILIDGSRVNETRAASRNLAMVFQSYALYPHLTVADNMMTPLKLRDLTVWQRFPILGPLLSRSSYKALYDQVRSTAEVLKIEHLLARKPGQLSGGQRQRAALGRAMVRKPVAFLMDEPLSNLDAALRVHMRAELSELHRALGTTFIYVTHDQAEALTMSDRMAVMMEGQILQLASPAEIYQNPATIEVAEFVGSPKINILPAEVDSTGLVTCLGTAFGRRLSPDAKGDIRIGLRPEHLSITQEASRADFTTTVVHRENLGADIYLHTVISNSEHRLIMRCSPLDAASVSIGDTVHCTRVHGEAMAFGATGERLYYVAGSDSLEAQVA